MNHDQMMYLSPVIHLNGTGGDTLDTEWGAATHAIREAQDTLAHATLHGRDYYVKTDPNAFSEAAEKVREAHAALGAALEIVSAMHYGILQQID